MPVVGHIPQRGKGITEKFFQPGFSMVAHAEEFAQQTSIPSEADIPAYVAMAKKNGTWLTATLSLDERLLEGTAHPETLKTRSELGYLTPLFHRVVTEHNPYVAQASPQRIDYLERIVAFNAKLVRAFDEADIPVLVGTDTPVPGMVAGFSIHDELEAMARAGIDNRRVLEGATRLPAEWLGLSADRGVIDLGKRADLLLLDADPLADVANTRRISAVILGGRYLPRSELDRDMLALERDMRPQEAQLPNNEAGALEVRRKFLRHQSYLQSLAIAPTGNGSYGPDRAIRLPNSGRYDFAGSRHSSNSTRDPMSRLDQLRHTARLDRPGKTGLGSPGGYAGRRSPGVTWRDAGNWPPSQLIGPS